MIERFCLVTECVFSLTYCFVNIFKINLVFKISGCTVQHVGPQFPDQGSNPCPLQLEAWILTTGLPGKSCFVNIYLFYFFRLTFRQSAMEFSRPEYWSGQPFPSPGDLPSPRIEARSPALQVDSLPAKPQGKPKNTGVGSLSLLQRIFPTQESNWGLLYCRRLLYQPSYEGSLNRVIVLQNFEDLSNL